MKNASIAQRMCLYPPKTCIINEQKLRMVLVLFSTLGSVITSSLSLLTKSLLPNWSFDFEPTRKLKISEYKPLLETLHKMRIENLSLVDRILSNYLRMIYVSIV